MCRSYISTRALRTTLSTCPTLVPVSSGPQHSILWDQSNGGNGKFVETELHAASVHMHRFHFCIQQICIRPPPQVRLKSSASPSHPSSDQSQSVLHFPDPSGPPPMILSGGKLKMRLPPAILSWSIHVSSSLSLKHNYGC